MTIRQLAAIGETHRSIEGDPAHHLRVGEVKRAVPYFPDARIRLPPDVADMVGDSPERGAGITVEPVVALAVQPRRLQQVAVDIELQLLESGVADSHGHRMAITGQRQRALFRTDAT